MNNDARTTTELPAGAARSAEPVPAASPGKPLRRVGTLTMGIALIIAGILIVASLFFPALDLSMMFKLCPLLLVLLGCEVIWFSIKGKDRIRYDFLSMIVCFFVIFGSFALALIPECLHYYGPERDATEFRLTSQLDDVCAKQLLGNVTVVSCSSSVYLKGAAYDSQVKLEDLDHSAYIDTYVVLAGPYDSKEAFAADALAVCDRLKQTDAHFDSLTFSWYSEDGSRFMDLSLDPAYTEGRTAAQIAQRVDTSDEMLTSSYEFDALPPDGTFVTPSENASSAQDVPASGV